MSSIDDVDDDSAPELVPITGTNRLIDWVKVFTTPVLVTFNIFMISITLAITSDQTHFSILGKLAQFGLFAVPIVFVSSLISQLLGTCFNIQNDRLSYPYYAWRLRLKLSEIRDANAQTLNKRALDIPASLGEKNPKFKIVSHYHVNLSGDFGARRLMFRSKFKRDQFLSILRAVLPGVRITRWS
jgi:hypothetical protein